MECGTEIGEKSWMVSIPWQAFALLALAVVGLKFFSVLETLNERIALPLPAMVAATESNSFGT